MKRILAVIMAAMLLFSLAACGTNGDTDGTTGAASAIASPVELLNTVWASYAEEEKFPAAGGDMTEENMNMEGPGVYGIEDTEGLDATLGFPAASVDKIDSAASLMHMMNANTFTCGAYHVKNTADIEALTAEIKDNITNRQWMCGFPDKLVIIVIDDFVVSYFGNEDVVNTFSGKLATSYTQSQVVCEEPLV